VERQDATGRDETPNHFTAYLGSSRARSGRRRGTGRAPPSD
jgi:hypothetical protein